MSDSATPSAGGAIRGNRILPGGEGHGIRLDDLRNLPNTVDDEADERSNGVTLPGEQNAITDGPDPYDRGDSNGETANREDAQPSYSLSLGPGVVPEVDLLLAEQAGFAAARNCKRVEGRRVIYRRGPIYDGGPDCKPYVFAVLAERHDGDAQKAVEAVKALEESGVPYAVAVADLVTTEDIADRLKVKQATVRKWIGRHEDFPKPLKEVAKSGVWDWNPVEEWAIGRGHLPEYKLG